MNPKATGIALILAVVTAGCTADGEIIAPERVALGSQIDVEVSTTIALMATECTDQLDCDNDTGVVESVRFEPAGMVELLSTPDLPSWSAAVTFRALKSGVVTVIAEGDFGSEEVDIEIVAPASARVVGHEKVVLPPGGVMQPTIQLYDADGERLAGFMRVLESSDPAITIRELNEINAGEALGDYTLEGSIGGDELMRVRVSDDALPDAIEGGVHEVEGYDEDTRFLGVELFQDGYFMPGAAVLVNVAVVEEGLGTCQLMRESFMSDEQIELTLWNPGTCKIALSTENGVTSELRYEVK